MPITYWSTLIVPITYANVFLVLVYFQRVHVLDLNDLCCRCFVVLKRLYEVVGKTGHHFYALIDTTQPNPKILNECIYD